jgi:2-oxoglutarate dehydrogenase E1 component
MQPKSMLRLPAAASMLADLAEGQFQPVIDDPQAGAPADVRRLVFCTGKVYYDLAQSERRSDAVAIVRVEELYPWPHEELRALLERYPAVEEVVWVQEEPRNMGAWTYVQPLLRATVGGAVGVRYVGRPERASPAEGYADTHKAEQERIVTTALDVGAPVPRGTPTSAPAHAEQSA